MKYIKVYENKYNDEYWKINSQSIENVKLALLKVGVTGNLKDAKHNFETYSNVSKYNL